MDPEGLPATFVSLVREAPERVLPCVGAGLSVPAGIRNLAEDVADAAASRGLSLDDRDLASVVAALEVECGVVETQRLIAGVVSSTPLVPTPTQKALALCPSRIVATFNYDNGLELAAEAVGRIPRSLIPGTAEAFRAPGADEFVVLHLHGAASHPSSIIMPGQTTEQLVTNEGFMRLLTALWAQHTVVYFGFSFAPTEIHLFEALDWLAENLGDADVQRLLLREPEVQQRSDQLARLVANPRFELVPYPDTPGHRAVLQAALLLGPRNDPAVDNVERLAPDPAAHFEHPALLELAPGVDPSAIQAETYRADWNMGAAWVTIPELLGIRRAVVIAAPGMGKTQLLRAAGREHRPEKALLVPLKELAGLLDSEEDAIRAFARLAVGARAFDESTPVPTRERLEDGAYMFLLDALDEVPPGRRAEVIAGVTAAAGRWPQHGYIVTTRPTVAAAELLETGFRSFRIVQSDGWAARYVQRRGVPDERLVDLRTRAPTASRLMGNPTYAAAICEALIAGIDVSDRPIDLLLHPVRALSRLEAEKQGKPRDAYFAWLRRLAVGLELRGRTDTTTAELAELHGPEAEESLSARERLVQAALLNDIPDRTEFPQRTVQEALCADALLSCPDVVAVVRAVAAADLAGEEVLRGDIDHCLDQVWANATAEQRTALRTVDEYRWARTVRSDCEIAEAQAAFEVIWRWHREHRIWMDWATQGELRGAREALSMLATSHPDVIRARRAELIAATRSSEPTERGNAVDVLTELGKDDDTAGWLLPLLDDSNEVVRRFAAQTVSVLEVPEAREILVRTLPSRSDASESDACARALLKLTPDEQLGGVAEVLRQNGRLWTTVGDQVGARLSLDDALAVLNAGIASRDGHLGLLRTTLERHPPESWTPNAVQVLAAGLIRHDVQPHEDVDTEQISELARRQPAAALSGIRDGAHEFEVLWTNLFFVESLDDTLLNAEANGTLAEPYSMLLERKAARARTGAGQHSTRTRRQANTARARPNSARARTPSMLGRQLDDGTIREDRVPQHTIAWQVEDLSEPQRRRLADLVEAWWPDRPLADVILATANGVQGSNEALAAVCASAALDLDLTDERWLNTLAAAGAMYLQPDIVGWLHRHYRPEMDELAAAIIRGTEDEWHVYYAIGAFAPLSETVACAFIDRLPIITDPYRIGWVAQTLISAGHAELLRVLDDAGLDPARRDSLLEVKADAGDVDAQLSLTNETLQKQRDGERSPPLRFAHAVTDARLVEPLADLLGLLGPSGGGTDDLQRSVVQALASTRSVTALRAYDRLIAHGSFAAAFFWYPRTELARAMARDQVLGRLPVRIADVPNVLDANPTDAAA